MKKSVRSTAFLCAAVLLLVGCGCGKKAPRETKTDEVTYVENKFVNLHCKYPNTMTEVAFTPRDGADGEAYGVTDGDGRFFGFTVEITDCTPGDYDPLDPESFLEKYFPEQQDQAASDNDYWLRSPSFIDPYMGYVYTNGGTGAKDAADPCGLRLMMWIKK